MTESPVSRQSGGDRLAAFVLACGGARGQIGRETVCRCPAHDDENPSLNVALSDDDNLLVTCRAGCATKDIVRRIGWKMSDLMGSTQRPASGKPKTGGKTQRPQVYPTVEKIAAAAAKWKKGKVESTHIYRDVNGEPVFGIVRVRQADGSKDIPQIRAAADGWVFGGIKKDRPLYRLPDLLAASRDVPVCLFEGELKADLAAELGFVATSCSQGAGNAKLTDFVTLNGRVVHLFADNDSKGQEHMVDAARRAYEAGAIAVWQVSLPGLPPKGDIVDFVQQRRDAGAGDEEITDAIRDAVRVAELVEREPATQSEDHEQDEEPAEEPAESPPAATVADQLVALAAEAELIHDDRNETFASIDVDGHRETWRIGSEHFGLWLCSKYYRRFKTAVPPAALVTAVAQLSAIARFDGEKHRVNVRVARAETSLFLDLCNDKWQAIEITGEGWRIVDAPPVRFTRRQGMRALPHPTAGLGSMDALFDLLHLDNQDLRLLITAWLVNAITLATSYPILAVTGEQGSGKTTFCRALQRLVDPHDLEGRSPPRNEEDVAVAAQHTHLIVYENLSGLSSQLSDALCRIATGAGFAARKLYSNDEERQLRFCRPVLVNGIDELATRSDLADRTVNVQLPTIERSRRRTETDLWKSFDELHPQLLGTLLDLLVRVLQQPNPSVQLERMADYSVLGAKVAVALRRAPSDFVDAYRANRDSASLTSLESSSIGPVLRRLVNQGPFDGPMAGLLHDLQQTASAIEVRHPEWPRSPRGLGDCLRRLNPDLARIGIRVTPTGRRADGYWIHVAKDPGPDVHDVHNVHRAWEPDGAQ